MEFKQAAETVIKALDKYYSESVSGNCRVINQKPMQEIIDNLNLSGYLKDGNFPEESLADFLDKYLSYTTRLHHPAYLAHQVAVPHFAGALGSLIDGFTNNAMAIYEMGPPASSIEYFVINFLLEKAGWKPAPVSIKDDHISDYGGGVLTHGGSLANLTGLVMARNKVAPEVWKTGNPGNLAAMVPESSHYSIEKAIGLMGIGSDSVVKLETDKNGAVIPDRIPGIYKAVKDSGKKPFVISVDACSTATGIYDPLEEIGSFCNENKIWFHVDGAHGAGALFSSKYRNLLKGIQKADSMSWDAHKLLRTPTLCAALLVKDHKDLDTAFEQKASYIFHEKEQPGYDFIHRTMECTKAALGLKFYLVLVSQGEKGLEDYIDRQFDLTAEAYEYIKNIKEFECPHKPQSNILCFRIPGSDKRQLFVRDKLIEEGSYYISSAVLNGKRYLRLTIMSPETQMKDIKGLIKRIKEISLEKTGE